MIVTSLTCQLYKVTRTDMGVNPWHRIELSYAPRSYMDALRLADDYQQTFDPERNRYDYRVSMAS